MTDRTKIRQQCLTYGNDTHTNCTAMKVNRSIVRLTTGAQGELDKVENGILAVWPITVSAYALKSENHAQLRLQRNVVVASKTQG